MSFNPKGKRSSGRLLCQAREKTIKHTDYVNEIEKDPEYRQGKEALKARFALGDAVLRARIERGLSQTELAAQVGTKQANISRIEAGLANPTLDLIQKIIRVLELGIEFPPLLSSITHPTTPYSQKKRVSPQLGTIHPGCPQNPSKI